MHFIRLQRDVCALCAHKFFVYKVTTSLAFVPEGGADHADLRY